MRSSTDLRGRRLLSGRDLYGPNGLTSLSRTTIWRAIRAGTFPSPVRPSPGRNAWLADEVADWLDRLRA